MGTYKENLKKQERIKELKRLGLWTQERKDKEDWLIKSRDSIELVKSEIEEDSDIRTGGLTIRQNYIGYANGLRYSPNKGLTKYVVETLSLVFNGRKKGGKIYLNPTLTNFSCLLKVHESTDIAFTDKQINTAIYSVRGELNKKKIPIAISIKGNKVIVEEK